VAAPEAAGVPPVAAGDPLLADEHAASASAATMPTGISARRVKEFAIEDPFSGRTTRRAEDESRRAQQPAPQDDDVVLSRA
jgi:hypothetical protein